MKSRQSEKHLTYVFEFMKALAKGVSLKNLWLIDHGAFVGDPYYLYRPRKLIKAMEYSVLRDDAVKLCRETFESLEKAVERKAILELVEKSGAKMSRLSGNTEAIRFCKDLDRFHCDVPKLLKAIETRVNEAL